MGKRTASPYITYEQTDMAIDEDGTRWEEYSVGMYVVEVEWSPSGRMRFSVMNPLHERFIPEIYTRKDGSFEIQTCAYGALPYGEIQQLIEGYEYALSAVDVLESLMREVSSRTAAVSRPRKSYRACQGGCAMKRIKPVASRRPYGDAFNEIVDAIIAEVEISREDIGESWQDVVEPGNTTIEDAVDWVILNDVGYVDAINAFTDMDGTDFTETIVQNLMDNGVFEQAWLLDNFSEQDTGERFIFEDEVRDSYIDVVTEELQERADAEENEREASSMRARKQSFRRKTAYWYDDPVADEMNEKYLPSYGDGDNMATQIATAVNKLVYKWFNDGDVFDNVMTGLEGWANDISGSANWLYKYVPETKMILRGAFSFLSKAEYEDLLRQLFQATLCNPELMDGYAAKPRVGDAYNEEGPFAFEDYDDEWDEWDDDDEEW